LKSALEGKRGVSLINSRRKEVMLHTPWKLKDWLKRRK
jgi:hypothetical protein